MLKTHTKSQTQIESNWVLSAIEKKKQIKPFRTLQNITTEKCTNLLSVISWFRILSHWI